MYEGFESVCGMSQCGSPIFQNFKIENVLLKLALPKGRIIYGLLRLLNVLLEFEEPESTLQINGSSEVLSSIDGLVTKLFFDSQDLI
jgi:hypothetical protein